MRMKRRRKVRLLDLFSGAGGAAYGYWLAAQALGIDIEIDGVDIVPQPQYPFHFIQADAMTIPLDGYDLIHASPPCQDFSPATGWLQPGRTRKTHPRLITPTRERLKVWGGMWVLENVRNALVEMENPVMLCGTSLGLRVQRHRIFDSSHLLFAAGPCRHRPYDVSVRTHRAEYLGGIGEMHLCHNGQMRFRNAYCPAPEAKKAMGIDWMTMDELGEAIPPAYTEHLGRQLLTAFISEQAIA